MAAPELNLNKTREIIRLGPGSEISHYRILEELGAGGMGVVYKARDLKLGRDVALKFLSERLTSQGSQRARFIREAQSASALNHPGICVIYDFHEEHGLSFISMEFIDGDTIKRKLRDGPFDVVAAIEYLLQIAEALGAAHARGIIHRDIKADNIIINRDGRAKIMDFGLACLAGQGDLTMEPQIAGTPYYMSPEQIQGKSIDRRSDIFSLGIVFYEMITGRLPFAGDYYLAVLYAVIHSQPQPVEDIVPGIDGRIGGVIAKCLKKNPDDRYGSCDDLLSDVNTIIGQKAGGIRRPILAKPPGAKAPAGDNFIGREEYLRQLRAQIDAALAGTGNTVLISGEAGVGKTQLTARAAEYARDSGMSVFWGRGLYREAGLPYHAVASAIKSGLSPNSRLVLENLVARGRNFGIDISGQLAMLQAFLNVGPETTKPLNKEQLWNLVLQLLKLVSNDRPALLVIDDLHWADAASLDLFLFLARNFQELPILMVGTYRQGETTSSKDEELSPGLENLLRQLRIENSAIQIDLSRFTPEETGSAIAGLLKGGKPDEELVRAVYSRARGNPLFTAELVNLMKAQGAISFDGSTWRLSADSAIPSTTDRIRDIILQRLDRLAGADRGILELAACEGQSFGSGTMVSALGIDRIQLLKRLQSLEREHALIHHEGARYQFEHPLIREVIYEGIFPELRQEYHRLIAEDLMGKFKDDDEHASQIAHHLLLSENKALAPAYLLRAAANFRKVFACDDAVEYYRRAHEIIHDDPGRSAEITAQTLEGLGDCYASLGKTSEAEGYYSELLQVAEASSAVSYKISAHRKLGDTYRMIGKTEETLGHCQEAVDLSRKHWDPARLTESLNTLGFAYFSRAGNWELAVKNLEEALELARSRNDIQNQAISLGFLGLTYLHKGDLKVSSNWLEEALSIQQSINDKKGLSQTLNFLGQLYDRMGMLEQAITSYSESVEIKKKIGDFAAIPGGLNGKGDTYRDAGDIERAIDFHFQSLRLARAQQNFAAQCDNLRDLGMDFLILGDLAGAERYLTDVLALARQINNTWYLTRSHISMGELRLSSGQPGEAAEHAALGLEMARKLNARELIIEALWVNARIFRASDHSGNRIKEMLEEAIGLAEDGGYNVLLWQLLRDLGVTHGLMNDHDMKRECFQKAKRVLTAILEQPRDRSLCGGLLKYPSVVELLEFNGR